MADQDQEELKPCGTYAAYRRHEERREEIDDLCREAYREYNRIRAVIRKQCGVKGTGTRAGYMRHWREGDVAAWREGSLERCEPCTAANSRASSNAYTNRRANKDAVNKYKAEQRLRVKAVNRAQRALAKRHPAEYEELRTQELRKLRKEAGGEATADRDGDGQPERLPKRQGEPGRR